MLWIGPIPAVSSKDFCPLWHDADDVADTRPAWGGYLPCALNDARVVRTYERIYLGETSQVVTVEFPEEHGAHVCGLLETDDRVMSYSF